MQIVRVDTLASTVAKTVQYCLHQGEKKEYLTREVGKVLIVFGR